MYIKRNSLDCARFAADLADSKKAENIIILDMGKASNICDYFVIISAESSKRVGTIAEAIEDGFEREGIKIAHSEGYKDCLWILLDIQDVIVHIFREDIREFYCLERLWSHAPEVALK